jgi:hypothetical protein
MNKKIFLNIASYRDPLVQYTIDNVIHRAKHPENLVFGVCWQYGEEENKELNFHGLENRVLKVPAFQSKGCSWARNLVFQTHKDEEYFWLIDSHMDFADDWDVSLLEQFEQTEDEKALLSCAVSQWNIPGRLDWHNDSNKRAVTRASTFWGSVLLQMFEVRDNIEKPELNSFLTACNLFGHKNWLRDVPYDPDMFFLGEEITLAVRSFTHGYNHYATKKTMAYHRHDRGYRREFNDDHYGTAAKLTEVSSKRLETLLTDMKHVDLGMYGLGTVRTVEQYEKYAGVDFKNKIISDRAKTGRPDLNYL